jgi:hypothetical protein
LEELEGLRRNAITKFFMDALVKGGPNGHPKPIELHAHEPIRYVGDMLAWIHQTAASEREMLHVLLKGNMIAGDSNEFSLPMSILPPSDDMTSSFLTTVMEGTCRPLKLRIEQVLGSLRDVTLSYKLANLLQFYRRMLVNVLGKESNLSLTLSQ